MTRSRIVLLGSALSITNVLVTTAVGFFLMPFIVHGLGDRMYGYWALVGSVLGYYGILDLGISPAVSFQVAKAIGKGDSESPNRVLSTAVVAFSALGMAVIVVTAVVAACCPWFIKNPPDVGLFRTVLTIAGFGLALGFPGRAFMGGIYGHIRNDLLALVGIVGFLLKSSLIVVVILKGQGIVGIALASLLTDAASYVAHYLILRSVHKGLHISLALADRGVFKELMNYGGYSVIIRVGDQLRFAVDSWMVAAFVGIVAVAHYAIASRLSGYFLTFIVSALSLLQSWFSQLLGGQNFDGIRKMLRLATKVATLLSTVVTVSFILYGRVFIAQWMGPSYVDAYWPAVILVSALFTDLAQQPSVSYLLGVSRHRYLAFQTLGEGIANLLLSMYWARQYGMVGVALGTLVPMVIAKLFLQPAYVCRQTGIPLQEYYVGVLGKSAMVPASLGIVTWWFLFRSFHLSSLWRVCAVVVLQAALSALASFFFVLERDDRHRILNKWWPARNTEVNPSGSASLSPELIAQRGE
jgi:O-antigen/teichoic acid export membrane protein